MKFLLIDTSGPDSFVALAEEDHLLTKHLPTTKQSQILLPAIEALLAGKSVDFIAVGTGPGSFTGTRVGVMMAKALAFAKEVPVVPFCSLQLYTPDCEGPFTLYGDAKSSGTFVLEGVRTPHSVSYTDPYVVSKKYPPSTKINILFIVNYIKNQFAQTGGVDSLSIRVCYLKNP